MEVSEYYTFQGAAKQLTNLKHWQEHKERLRPEYRYVFSRWLPKDKTSKILEAASGSGVLLSLIREDGYLNAEGSDSSPADAKLAEQAGVPVVCTDSIEWLKQFAPESVDVIIACNFYEHIPKEVFLDFLHFSQRALKKGGSLILQGPNGDSPVVGRNLFNDITHYWAYTSIALRALSEMAGFSRVEFIDGALSGVAKRAWLKRPIIKVFQYFAKTALLLATREHVANLGAFLWTRAVK